MSFGLVTMPVALYPATQSHTVQFHQLERGTSVWIRYRRVNERRPEEYQDTYQERVQALLADKRAGRVTEAEPAEPTTVVDQAADDIDALSKADLMKLARELDIPGRWTITRDELRPAGRMARAGHPTRKAS